MPDIPAFRGPDVLCGLAGNLDGDCKDDLRLRNGTVLPAVPIAANQSNPCTMDQFSMISEQYGDNWIVPQQDHGCILGTVLANTTLPCDGQYFTDAGVTCQPILDALNAVNYFAQCQGMGAAEINRYYQKCQWEICVQNKSEEMESEKCTMLTEFAHACQSALPGTRLGEWRKGLTCPLYCPNQSSDYSDCATGCPDTCTVHGGPVNCTRPCIEGCACKPGYVFDNGTCIALGNCSCFDGSSAHDANSVWYAQNCTIRKECHDGAISSEPIACDQNANCASSGGQEQCVCKIGFTGDGVHCADIDECLNTTLCGQAQAQGWCNNTIGSYFCTCNPNFDGQECERFYPRRHCADLYIVHNDTTSGIKTIYPSFAFNGHAANSPLTVYCDMAAATGGGWTAFTGSDGNSTVGKTFAEYENGFGNANANDYWLGLSYLYGATHEFQTTLRISLEFCNGEQSVEWIYPDFSILNATYGYAPLINGAGSGSAGEGWIMNWPNGQGPRFSGTDNCQMVAANSTSK
uniref:Uncharacterized protein n=1 Tax=Plectus sambesii TaxID=2011161 RepID=A0A914VLB7_9BILA